jgi:hypothetical protein
MLKKTINYTDFNGEERNEDFYFNLTKAEVAELEMSINGGLSAMIEKISNEQDNVAIMKIFKELILKSYGEKSIDGKRFIKSEELSIAFSQTEAYSELFMEIATDPDKAVKFFENIIPSVENKPQPIPNNVN